MKKILLFCATAMCALSMSANWNDTKMPVQASKDDAGVSTSYTLTLSDGTVVVVWNQPGDRSMSPDFGGWGGVQFWMNSFDADGNSLCNGPLLISGNHGTRSWTQYNHKMAMVDKDDNIIVAVEDCRNLEALGDYENHDMSYILYKLDKYGNMLWDEPVDLGRGMASNHYGFSMCQLADGSYVTGWGTQCDDLGLDAKYMYIMMERVSNDGKLLWDETKAWYDSDTANMYCYITDGGDNEFNVVTAHGSGQFVTARRYDFEGEPVWTKDCTINYGAMGSIPMHVQFVIEEDGEGGLYAGWHDFTVDGNYDVAKLAHINREGKHVYNSGIGGTQVTYFINPEEGWALRSCYVKFVEDKATNDVYVLHRIFDGSSQTWNGIAMQKLDERGNLMWGPEGSKFQDVEKRDLNYEQISLDDEGNPVAFYLENPYNPETYSIDIKMYVEKLSAVDGSPMWSERVAVPTDPQYNNINDLQVTPMINNEFWVLSWTCTTGAGGRDDDMLYVMRVNNDGTTKVLDVKGDKTNDAPAEYFGINGVTVSGNNLTPGIYIKRQGSEVSKFIVK